MTKNKITYLGDLRTECTNDTGGHILTDAPKDHQGHGNEFSPTDLLALSLGSCMLTLMGITARSLDINLNGATIEVEKKMSQQPPRRIALLIVRFRYSQHLPEETQKKLEQAALHCPVHYSLHPDIRQEIDFVWGI